MDLNSGEPRRPLSEKSGLPADREAALAAVKRCGRALEYVSEPLRSDPELRGPAVARCPRAGRLAPAPDKEM